MNFTRTKIICTIGPATEKLSALRKLHSNGMNVARINMSHATHKSAKLIIDRIKKINSETKNENGKIGVLLDTQGPEIRTGDTELPLELKVGEEVTLTVRDQVDVETSSIKINYKDLKLIILSGSSTAPLLLLSPLLMLSTCSKPSITFPKTVYCLSKKGAGLKQIKN